MRWNKLENYPIVRLATAGTLATGVALFGAGCDHTSQAQSRAIITSRPTNSNQTPSVPSGDQIVTPSAPSATDFLAPSLQKKLQKNEARLAEGFPVMDIHWEGQVDVRRENSYHDLRPLKGIGLLELDKFEAKVDKQPTDGSVLDSDSDGIIIERIDKPNAGESCFPVVTGADFQPEAGTDLSPLMCRAIWKVIISSGSFNPRLDLIVPHPAITKVGA